ncbi:MAG: hypothetical protein KDD22_08285 [Bdellovibrionales bacterium]|nr:hypothetical protein [Bdellovibrionales bacterium]
MGRSTLSNVIPLLMLTVSLGLTGCNSSSGGGSSTTSQTDETQQLQSTSNKVYFDQATLEEIADYVAPCHGKSKKMCVYICHKPPGNPENCHSKILPLSAYKGHMHKGVDAKHRDTLGDCTPGDTGGDDGGVSDDNGSSDDSGDMSDDNGSSDNDGDMGDGGTSDDDPIVDTGELPPWCESVQAIDADCDGYNDTTGDPIF